MFLYQTPEPEKIVRVIRDGSGVAREDQTIKHISSGWLPVNQKLLKSIDVDLSDPKMKANTKAIVKKAKSDAGLFLRCARELPSVQPPTARHKNPIEAMEALDFESLKLLLAKASEQFTVHHEDKATTQQGLRAQHALVASIASERLAIELDIDSNTAYSAAMFSELGLLLVSWNYPTIYNDVMSRHRKDGEDIDIAFERLLGMSPIRIGRRFASEWGVPAEVTRMLEPTQHAADVEKLREVCKAASIVADTADRFNYPNAESSLSNLSPVVRGLITPELLDRVRKTVVEIVRENSADDSPMRGRLMLASPHGELTAAQVKSPLLAANSYLMRCKESIRVALEQMYLKAADGAVSIAAIKVLIKDAVPILGFECGCLYLLNSQGKLEPVLNIGTGSNEELRALHLRSRNLVKSSVYSRAPLKIILPSILGKEARAIVGAFDHSRYEGVLYLEENSADSESSEDILVHFHVFRRALGQFMGDK